MLLVGRGGGVGGVAVLVLRGHGVGLGDSGGLLAGAQLALAALVAAAQEDQGGETREEGRGQDDGDDDLARVQRVVPPHAHVQALLVRHADVLRRAHLRRHLRLEARQRLPRRRARRLDRARAGRDARRRAALDAAGGGGARGGARRGRRGGGVLPREEFLYGSCDSR